MMTVMFLASRRTRRDGMEDRVQSVLRCLQVGVMKEDANDRIIDANDRAEEVLGVPLPKLGADVEPEHAWRFSTLIEPVIVEHLENEELRAACYEDVIPKKRGAGSPSAYYARLRRGEGDWIRVIGSPLFLLDERLQDVEGPSSFGVLERAPEGELLEKVRSLYDQATLARFLWSSAEGTKAGALHPLNDASWQRIAAQRAAGDQPKPAPDGAMALEDLVDLDMVVARVGSARTLVLSDFNRVKDMDLPVEIYAGQAGTPGIWFALRITRDFENGRAGPAPAASEGEPAGAERRELDHAVITIRPVSGKDPRPADLQRAAKGAWR